MPRPEWRWIVAPHDESAVRTLADALSLHPLVARVLGARGLTDVARTRSFLAPRLADLTKPDAMLGRDAAADRLHHAIARHEPIAIYGDYDVDGATSAALLALALRALGGDVRVLSASRFDGGYGLSDRGVERVLATGARVLITCDCGTSDHPRLETLRTHDIDTIVVDHHKVPDEPLPALAFLNPHQPGCGFSYKHMASVGLALSLAAAVRARQTAPLDLREFLDLVALGTVADLAPLSGDNRILTHAGLARIASGGARPGVRALLKHTRLRAPPRAFDVGFSIGPLLNAPGRLGSPEPTVQLLMATVEADADRLADQLAAHNEARRAISQKVAAEAVQQVTDVYGANPTGGLVVGAEGWHPGIGGIVAGRLVDRFASPCIVVAFDGASGVGSARGPRGFPLFTAVARCSSLLERFGGHDGAAGMAMRREHFEPLRAAFAHACNAIGAALPTPSPSVDTELTESDLALPLVAQLDALEPTGMAHPEALVMARGVRVLDVREVGTGHLRARLVVGRRQLGAFVRDGVARRARGEIELGSRGTVQIVGRLRPDPFSGRDAVQLDVVDACAEE